MRLVLNALLCFADDSFSTLDANGNHPNLSPPGRIAGGPVLTLDRGIYDVAFLPAWLTSCSTYATAVAGGQITVVTP